MGSHDLAPGGYLSEMEYDGLNRLTAATSFGGPWSAATYGYDVLDNLTAATLVTPAGTQALACVYGTGNRLAEITRAGASAWTYTHDSRGNVTADGRQGYVWTDGDRLAAEPGKESYGYDALGRRVLVQRADGSGSVPMYRRDGRLHLTADNRLGGVNLHVSLGGRAIADVFHRWSDGQQTVTYLHTDALGSPILRTDAARVASGRLHYTPYGASLPVGGYGGAEDDINYTGHAYDTATGLVYMQQRYYDPVVGRFLSVDPVPANASTGGNFNRYWYGNDNPYRFVDPDGRYTCDGAGCAAAAAGLR